VDAYFNMGGCAGIRLTAAPGAPATTPDSVWDLYAFTNGFLSLQGGNDLVLRLPRELGGRHARFNSGLRFIDQNLTPEGPHLRHVVYRWTAAPGANVETHIRTLLGISGHPMRAITRVRPATGQRTETLDQFLARGPAGVTAVLNDFMAGRIELFVLAGDRVGNFRSGSVELRFVDSCAHNVAPAASALPEVTGRPLNPAYYLYLVTAAGNARAVNLLTTVTPGAATPLETHPLVFSLTESRVTAGGAAATTALNLSAPFPPPPLHVRVDVGPPVGPPRHAAGIPMAAVGTFHQSRNARGASSAPVRWRNWGNQEGDEKSPARFGSFLTEVVNEKLLPAGAQFDHQFTPTSRQRKVVKEFWLRYGAAFNTVAAALDLPVEFLLMIACTETGGKWFNINFAQSQEADVIRLESLHQPPKKMTTDIADQRLLTHYAELTGGVNGPGANANMPAPWDDTVVVPPGNALKWGQLRHLTRRFRGHGNVNVSPGVVQTTLATAASDIEWGRSIYGPNFPGRLVAQFGGINLTSDSPPTDLDDLFSGWFGVTVNANGENTVVAGSVDVTLTKRKRAFHSVLAGALHMKRMYNTRMPGKRGYFNTISDYDLPTICSCYNDGGNAVAMAKAGDPDPTKWKHLFALLYNDANYPQLAPRYFNATIDLFNDNPEPVPALRFWKG
jgi:hypothetical protein